MKATTNTIEILISSRQPQAQAIAEFWRLRELLLALTWRNVHVRYKQAAIGVLWVVIRPLIMVAIYTAIFGIVAKLPSIDGVPYSVMVLSGLVSWIYLSTAVSTSSNSFFSDSSILTKVYLPRMFIPLSHVLAALVDFLVTFAFLVGLMFWKGVAFTPNVFALGFVILFMTFFSFSFGLLLGTLTIRFRDVQHITPFIIQAGFYLSPVVYNSQLVPQQYQWLYYLNPAAGLIDSFRWCLLGQPVHLPFLIESLAATAVIFVLAIFSYRSIEPIMIDQL